MVAEEMQFMQIHQATLQQEPFASFLVCMKLAMPSGEGYRQDVADWLQPVRALIKPVSEGLFAGALDISKIISFSDRLKFRMSVKLGVWSEDDHRDWNAVAPGQLAFLRYCFSKPWKRDDAKGTAYIWASIKND